MDNTNSKKAGKGKSSSRSKFISYKIFHQMIERYRKAYMEPDSHIPPNTLPINYTWIPLKEILKLVKDNKVDINKPDEVKKTGIKVYCGTYGTAKDELVDLPLNEDGTYNVDYEHRNNLILVLTGENKEGEIVDYLNKKDSSDEKSKGDMALNHSSICPPTCPK